MIQLSEDFRISFEVKDNVTLEQRHVVGDAILGKESRKKGESVWKQVGYYSSIRPAVKRYFELELQKSNSLVDLFNRLEEMETKLETIFSFRFSPFYTV
jgi:hypothetical protein